MKAKVNAVFEPFFDGLGIYNAQINDKIAKGVLLSSPRWGKLFCDEMAVKFVINNDRALDFSLFEEQFVFFIAEYDIAGGGIAKKLGSKNDNQQKKDPESQWF